MVIRSSFLVLHLVLCFGRSTALWAQAPASGLQAYKMGDYATAIPLLKALPPAEQEAMTRAALLSALVYQGQIEEASDLSKDLETRFPNSPEVMTARGELFYYLGDVYAADKLFRAAIVLNPQNARAHLGVSRLLRAASFYRSARLSCLRAHALDGDDALITLAFLRYLTPERLREQYKPFLDAHPWFAQGYERGSAFTADIRKELAERKPFEAETPREPATIHLVNLLSGATRLSGFGIELSIEGGRSLRLLLDTGASGILLSQRAVDKAGLKHVGSSEVWGVGDEGARKTFAAFASTCSVGKLVFKNCVFDSLEGKRRIAGDEDGLIGTDFFASYLIHIDFQRHEMKLTPQPERPFDPQGYDRKIPPEEAGYTPVFRYGHMLMIPTKVNGKSSGLFAIDTGADVSNIDANFARLSTKIHGDDHRIVHGVSGKVANVFEADKAELEFGRFRQRNIGLTAFDLNNGPHHQDVRMSGILGLAVLAMFHLDIDYRNGLVNFDYILK